MIKAILCDLGDVCFTIDWFKINDEMMKRFNINTLIRTSDNDKAKQCHKDAREGKRHPRDMFNELNKDKHDLDKVVTFYKTMYKKYKTHNGRLFSLLRKLKKRFTLIALSDTNCLHYEAHVEQGTVKEFDRVFTSFELGSLKSDPNTFKKVLSEIHFKPEEIVFIDDSDKNIEVATSLGFKAIKYENYTQLVKSLKSLAVL